MVRVLRRTPLAEPVLVMEERRPEVAAKVSDLGLEAVTWHRRALRGRPASAWPPPGPFGTVLLRLPRSAAELDMHVQAALACLDPGGRLLVYGATDEGARSAVRRIARVAGNAQTVATGRRCRVIDARRGSEPPPRATLASWKERFEVELPGLPQLWVSYPGVFAHGRLDEGTALLVSALGRSGEQARRALDFGCGSGILAATLLAWGSAATVDMLDVDAVALEAAAENVPEGRIVLGDGWSAPVGGAYDLVASNPPCHEGKEQTLETLGALVSGAASRLARGGELWLVAQRRLPVERVLSAVLSRREIVADDGKRFRVWRVWT